jgi:hypothetical protein
MHRRRRIKVIVIIIKVYGLARFGFDMPSALLCSARFFTPDVAGGVDILPSMSYLV